MDHLKHQTPRQTAKPPIHRLPGWEMDWRHPPFTPRADEIADRVQNFAKVGPSLATRRARLWQERLHSRPFPSVRSLG
uniref:Uncharacterized protein n=1 Tax=Sphingomonas sp. KSM1 TaxID=1228049 RepID=M1VQK2_9SPHN|nr:hypothetical protein [Sphingomonas sp. KSM1]